jgi:hypothetical protein
MPRLAWLLVGACLLTVTVPVLAQDAEKKNPKTSYLDGKDAGPDFQIQGEYIGKVGANAYGLQVIARGDGKFDAVLLAGGLPGAGWDGKTRIALNGKTEGDATNLKSDQGSIKIAGGNAAVTWGDAQGELKKLHRESPTLGQRPPEGATVLFDGSNVDAWNPGKLAEPGLMGVGTRTKEKFGSFTLHLEFRSPYMPYANGQGRGNSGMYLHDQYECQILDSFGLEGKDNECGGIYINAKPLVNMCFPPLSWQTYDVEMTAAKFDDAGKVTAPAKVTIKHNGVVIHDQLELKVTPGGGQKDQLPGALYLQDHGDAVRFRNIWIVKKP